MKIGLEYEGVIFDKATSQVTRWSSIPKNKQFRIKQRMDMMGSEVEPCDGYDCLAEVRTEPLVDPNPETLINALMDAVELAEKAYESEGFHILWDEVMIHPRLHADIKLSLANATKKDTQYIGRNGVDCYSSDGNVFRGAGIHVNVSNVHRHIVPAMALQMHSALRGYMADHSSHSSPFYSNYRQNVLFRTRRDDVTGDDIGEYMSFGFRLPDERDGIRNTVGYGRPFSWMKHVVDIAEEFTQFKAVERVATAQ